MATTNGNNKTNLIINYLPQTLTDEEFRSMFLSIGPITSCKIVRDRATGYSYGFGFVDYVHAYDAVRAIQTLNGLQLQNKTIKVAFSRTGEDAKGANLYIRNIPRPMTQDELQALFAEYGSVIQCRILTDQFTGASKGVGFVLFDKKHQADEAMEKLNGKIPEGYTEELKVKYAEDNKGKARPPVVVVQNRGGGGYPPPQGNPGGGYGPGPMRNNQGYRYRYNPMTGNNGTPYSGLSVQQEGGYVLFVYNIGADANERALWQLFSPFGTVQKVNVIWDYQKNQSKGYGFVSMTNYHEGMNAIQGLNGYHYTDKPLQVSFKSGNSGKN